MRRSRRSAATATPTPTAPSPLDWSARNERRVRRVPGRADRRPAGPAPLGRRQGRRASAGWRCREQFLQPADQLLDEHFTDERLKTALAWLGAQSGPPTHEVATADLVGWNTLMHRRAPGRRGRRQRCAHRRRWPSGCGGSAARSGSATVPPGSPARGDRVIGVVTDSGERLTARAVVAGCHVLTTLELLGDETLLAAARPRPSGSATASAWWSGSAPPACRATPRPAGSSAYGALQLLAPSRARLRAAHGDFVAGRPPRRAGRAGHDVARARPRRSPRPDGTT